MLQPVQVLPVRKLISSAPLEPLFEVIVNHVPAPAGDKNGPFQMLVTNLTYDSYVGRYAIGRILRGTIRSGENAALIHADGSHERPGLIKSLFSGLNKVETTLPLPVRLSRSPV